MQLLSTKIVQKKMRKKKFQHKTLTQFCEPSFTEKKHCRRDNEPYVLTQPNANKTNMEKCLKNMFQRFFFYSTSCFKNKV